jgi:hypothetical protein
MRPQELSPAHFIHLTVDLYGEKKDSVEQSGDSSMAAIWRRSVHLFDRPQDD